MFSILVALATAAAAPGGPVPAPSAQENSVEGIFNNEDYPPGALDRGEQGTVEFNIDLDAQGSVIGCEITKSSGFVELDEKTCEIVRERANLKPAHDARGRPVPSKLTKSITWRMQDDSLPSGPWSVTAVTRYGSDGAPSSCQITFLGGMSSAWQQRTPCLDNDISTLPHGTTSLEMAMQFAPGPAIPVSVRHGDMIMARSVVSMKVDDTGSVKSCTEVVTSGPAKTDYCASFSNAEFRPRLVKGKPVVFDETITVTLIAHTGTATALGASNR